MFKKMEWGEMVHNFKEHKIWLKRRENQYNKVEVSAFRKQNYLSNVSQNRKKTGLSKCRLW